MQKSEDREDREDGRKRARVRQDKDRARGGWEAHHSFQINTPNVRGHSVGRGT